MERERFKQIIEDRDAQITQLKIEGDVARSQASALRKDVDDLKVKLIDYEKMSKFQKVVSTDSEAVSNLESKVGDLKKQLKEAEKEKKTDMNMQKMTFDSKVSLCLHFYMLRSHAGQWICLDHKYEVGRKGVVPWFTLEYFVNRLHSWKRKFTR